MMVFFAQMDAAPAGPAAIRPAQQAADPSSPAAKALAKRPGLDAIPAPAVPPLRGRPCPAMGRQLHPIPPTACPSTGGRSSCGKLTAWKLAAGSFVLADFGADEYAARQGLSVVQYYRFTERRQVGGFRYFLSAGQAPHGVMFGMDGQPFQADRLQVRQTDGRWAVCVGDAPLVQMGDAPEEANQVLDVIQRQHFDRICRLGTGEGDGKGMTFFVRSR